MSQQELCTLLGTSILEPIDAEIITRLLSETPFVSIPGVANVRDLGGLPITNHIDGQNGKPMKVRAGRLFRSAQVNYITPDGREKLKEFKIGAIFDLRTAAEVRKYAGLPLDNTDPSAGLLDFKEEGIEVYHIPMQEIQQLGTKGQTAMLLQYATGDDGLLKLYEQMLEIGGDSFGRIMRYILEQARLGDDGKGCVWHCHIGKDRTGVFSALLLEFLGVSNESIAQDYALTRIGLEPMRQMLIDSYKDLFTKLPQAAVALASCNASLMITFVELIRTKYGGARQWFIQCSGLSDEELDLIRAYLIEETS